MASRGDGNESPHCNGRLRHDNRSSGNLRRIDSRIRQRFPDHEIIWAYSSRMVKDWVKKRKNIDTIHPHEALRCLQAQGHEWAVVQSVHFLAGHEFYRLIEEAGGGEIRTAIGLPLLSSAPTAVVERIILRTKS